MIRIDAVTMVTISRTGLPKSGMCINYRRSVTLILLAVLYCTRLSIIWVLVRHVQRAHLLQFFGLTKNENRHSFHTNCKEIFSKHAILKEKEGK